MYNSKLHYNVIYIKTSLWCTFHKMHPDAVADPGFPVGGRGPIRGGMDLQHGHFLAKMYAKTKELGPVGGRVPGTLPRSANEMYIHK